MKRTLALRREPLADLTPAELGAVAGGAESPTLLSCPIKACFVESHLGTCWTWAC